MYILLIALHVIVCLIMISVILLQAGKGAEMGAAFGGSSQTIFGSRGPGTFLSKLTVAAAVLFMLTSLSLAVLSKERSVGSTIPLPKEGAMPPMDMPAAQLPPPAGQAGDGQSQTGKTETSSSSTAAPATKQEGGPSASAPTIPTTGQGTNPAPTASTPAAPAPAAVPKTNP